MSTFSRVSIAFAILLFGNLSQAASERPPPPEEAFRYVAFDAGDAFELDWAAIDGICTVIHLAFPLPVRPFN